MDKKKVSIVIPQFNKEENIRPITEAVIDEITANLPEYNYEVLIIDNNSQDNTRMIIRELRRENNKIKAIFNEQNFNDIFMEYEYNFGLTKDQISALAKGQKLIIVIHMHYFGKRFLIILLSIMMNNLLTFSLHHC